MKLKIAVFFCLIAAFAAAQKMPDGGVNRVRISGSEKTILAEIQSADTWAPVDPHKTYYWYSSNTVHSTQGGYSGKLLNGSYTEYYLNKNLKEQGMFKNGLKTGTWKNWNEKGNLLSIVNWDAGIKSGKFELLDDGGVLKTSGSYRNNELDGNIKNYITADSVTIVRYKNGKVVPQTAGRPFWNRINIFKSKRSKTKH